jgi:hypothetical protein
LDGKCKSRQEGELYNSLNPATNRTPVVLAVELNVSVGFFLLVVMLDIEFPVTIEEKLAPEAT